MKKMKYVSVVAVTVALAGCFGPPVDNGGGNSSSTTTGGGSGAVAQPILPEYIQVKYFDGDTEVADSACLRFPGLSREGDPSNQENVLKIKSHPSVPSYDLTVREYLSAYDPTLLTLNIGFTATGTGGATMFSRRVTSSELISVRYQFIGLTAYVIAYERMKSDCSE